MVRELRAHLTYANVAASLALFLVLTGGVAFAVTALDDDSVRSRHIVDGQVRSPDLGKSAAVAYAHMDPDTCVDASGPDPCTVEDGKGVTAIARSTTGEYCVTVPGSDGGTTAAAIMPEYNGTSLTNGEGNASVLQQMTPDLTGCGRTRDFTVLTFAHPNVSVRNAADTGSTVAIGQATPSNEIGFTIVVP